MPTGLHRTGLTWCDDDGAAPHTTACSAETRRKIDWLKTTAASLGERTQTHLWNDKAGAFVNKMPSAAYPSLSEDAFYTRISPTSFYPLMPVCTNVAISFVVIRPSHYV